jgi:hypothetical protein
MELHRRNALESGLFHFRVVVRVRVEEYLWAHQPAGGSSMDPRGSLDMIESAIVNPEDAGLEGTEWRASRGIHHVGGPVFFWSVAHGLLPLSAEPVTP